jgi:hypothetical protein
VPTHAIPVLERTKSSLFIRPRRFGKSLVLSMLENYYDISRRDAFESIFGKLAIGSDPTALRNSYFILRWDFSCIDPTGSPDDIKRSLYGHINVCIEDFVRRYRFAGFDFADLCGFREEEVAETLREIAELCGMENNKADEALSVMRSYYNGYNFIPRSTDFLYNPTICLYFFKQFQKRCAYPEEMLDANLASDDSKLEYITGLPGGTDMILDLNEKGAQVNVSRLQKRFGLQDMLSDYSKDRIFIASFLYYFGVLTLSGETEQGELCLKVPNMVMQGMFVERVRRMMLPNPVIRDRGLTRPRGSISSGRSNRSAALWKRFTLPCSQTGTMHKSMN